MVVVFLVLALLLVRLEEELVGHELVDHAGETPDIGVVEVLSLDDGLR